MNKIILTITSLFVLSACSGGGGSGGMVTTPSDEFCSLADASKNGYDVSNAVESMGIRNFENVSNCRIKTCSSNYEVNELDKTCSPILCTMENTSLQNLTAVTGNLVSGCVATACSWGYSLDSGVCEQLQCDPLFQVVNMNSCEDKDVVDAEVSFTKTLTADLLNDVSIGATSLAKEAAVFSDDLCEDVVQDYLEIASFLKAPVPSGDGNKTVYVKYRNGTKNSSCLPVSIKLDQSGPSVSVSYPNLVQTIAGNNLTITGTCSDENFSSFNIQGTMGVLSSNALCLNGQFSLDFDISQIIPSGVNYSVVATDGLGNVSTLNSSFTRIQCSSYQNTVGNICEDKEIQNAEVDLSVKIGQELNTSFLIQADYAQSVEGFLGENCAGSSLFSQAYETEIPVATEVSSGTIKTSVLFKNGTKTTCVNSPDFIKDIIPPTISQSVTVSEMTPNPLDSFRNFVEGNALTVNGNCSDAVMGQKVVLTLIPQYQENLSKTLERGCSGDFTATFDISDVATSGDSGTFSLKQEAYDFAGNKVEVEIPLRVMRVEKIPLTVNITDEIYGKVVVNYLGEDSECTNSSCSFDIYSKTTFNIKYELLYNGKFISQTNPRCSLVSCSGIVMYQPEIFNYSFGPERYLEARDDSVSVEQDSVLYKTAAELGTNDRSLVGRTFSVVSVSNPVGGTVVLSGQNFVFTPSVKTGETAGFNYTIRDSSGEEETAYVSVEITPLPSLPALIFDTTVESESAAQSPPVSMDQIFNNWGRFESRNDEGSSVNTFYDNLAAVGSRAACTISAGPQNGLPGQCTETKSWVFNSTTGVISSNLNSYNYIGFVSPTAYENYELETTLTSSGEDDDSIGLVLAFDNSDGNINTLSVIRTNGGMQPDKGFGIVYNYKQTQATGLRTQVVYSNEEVGVVRKTATGGGGGGWGNRKTKVKVQRTGDIFRVMTSNFTNLDLVTSKMLSIDLNSYPELAKFKGAKKYGYSAFSQDAASFLNTTFTSSSEMDSNKIYDIQTGEILEYINGTGWVSSSQDLAEQLGYPREVYNPKNGKVYYIGLDKVIRYIETRPVN